MTSRSSDMPGAATRRAPHPEVLAAVERLYARNGNWPVTVREIADEVGLSLNPTFRWLNMLADAGYVEKGPRRRGFRPCRS